VSPVNREPVWTVAVPPLAGLLTLLGTDLSHDQVTTIQQFIVLLVAHLARDRVTPSSTATSPA
jgi:hypothetical protein